MGLIQDVVSYSTKVVRLTDEVAELRREMQLSQEAQHAMDRRLVRLETVLDIAMRRPPSPGSD